MIRWSALSDVIETSNLKALYVQFGKGYSDFSVGRFQLKPSFAETLESDFNRLLERSEKDKIGVAAFATAYNAGYRRGAAVLRKESALLRFHTGMIFSKPAYSYADIALDLFRKFPSI